MHGQLREPGLAGTGGQRGRKRLFVSENALGGGVTVSLAQDMHGKSLSFVMLGIELHDAGGAK